MTDAPEDLPDLSDADRETIKSEAEKISTEAKSSFSLSDRLQGIRRRTARSTIFLDLDAVEAYQRQSYLVSVEQQGYESLQHPDDGVEVTPEELAEALDRFNAEDAKLEELKAPMFKEALSIYMKAIPNVAINRATREARKAYAVGGKIPSESQDVFLQKQEALIMADCIEKIVDSSGDILPSNLDDIEQLQQWLDVNQWRRLVAKMNELLFIDALGLEATDDPGF